MTIWLLASSVFFKVGCNPRVNFSIFPFFYILEFGGCQLIWEVPLLFIVFITKNSALTKKG